MIVSAVTVLATATVWSGLPVGVQVAIWTAIGALGLKVGEKYLNKHAEELAERKDYRDEIKELRERVDKLEASLGETRSKLFSKEEEVAELRTQLIEQGLRPNPPSTRMTEHPKTPQGDSS